MSFFKRIIVAFLFLLFICVGVTRSASLYSVKSGQASLNVIVAGNSALFIDCGAAKPSDWVIKTSPGTNDLNVVAVNIFSKILSGVNNFAFICTHNDDDHTNLLVPIQRFCAHSIALRQDSYFKLKAEIAREESRVVSPFYPYSHQLEQKRTKLKELENKLSNIALMNIQQRTFLHWNYSFEGFNKILIEKYLGEGFDICGIKPKSFLTSTSNDRNLIIKITCFGKSFLFMGDAPGSLIKKVYEECPAELSNPSIVTFPHHGSDASDEFTETMKFINSGDTIPLIFIQSDPILGKNHLPLSETIRDFSLHKKTTTQFYCAPHFTSSSYRIGSKIEALKAIMFDARESVWLPVFNTNDATFGYKTTINASGITTKQIGEDSLLPILYYNSFFHLTQLTLPTSTSLPANLFEGSSEMVRRIYSHSKTKRSLPSDIQKAAAELHWFLYKICFGTDPDADWQKNSFLSGSWCAPIMQQIPPATATYVSTVPQLLSVKTAVKLQEDDLFLQEVFTKESVLFKVIEFLNGLS